MKFRNLLVEGAYIIEPKLFEDERGIFRRSYCEGEYANYGLETTVSQGNISENPFRYTLRGFHFQKGTDGEAKTLSCITGSIYNIIVDIRKTSKTYMKWVAVEISSAGKESIYVPSGCANAYLTMEDNTIIHYYMSKAYVAESYMGFNYKDETFEFTWPNKVERISDKDKNLPLFKDIVDKLS